MVSAATRVRRLALLGGESSGKTTLAAALAQALGTVFVPEYGRQLWEELRETLSPEQLLHVAQTQVAWEDDYTSRAKGWLICDTTALTTLQYCLHDHGQAPEALHALARRHYDGVFICEPDFAFVQDGCRRDDEFRAQQHAWTLAQLTAMAVQPVMLSGPVAQRVATVLSRIANINDSFDTN